MIFSKPQLLLATLAAARSALAHTTFTEFYIDGVSNGPGTCVRMNHNGYEASFPIPDLNSNDMACGISGDKGVDRVCTAKAGSTITFEYHSWANDKSKPSLDASHKGPCAVYMKKVDSAVNDKAYGDGWFKIWDEGYVDGTWCTNRMINERGLLSAKIPQLAAGYYLIRPELLALHAADDGDPQFYAGCAQVYLESNGDLAPAETVSIPGYVKSSDKSVTWNIYYGTDPNEYPIPGPKVATLKSGASTASIQANQREGKRPEGCILENGNFCAFEVPEYSDENGCWASGQNCWDQQANCWDSIDPTGGKGCDILSDRCEALNNACRARNFVGPPDAGKMLNHQASTLSNVPAAAATHGASPADVDDTPAAPAPQVSNVAADAEENNAAPAPTAIVVQQPSNDEEEEEKEHEEAPVEQAPAPTSAPAYFGGNVVTEYVWQTKIEYVTKWVK